MTYRTPIADKFRGAGVTSFILAACVLWMPAITDIREPRSLVLGCLIMAACGMAVLGRSFWVGVLMVFVAVHTYVMTPTMSALFPITIMACLCVVYTVTVLSWGRWHVSKETIYNAICLVALLNVAAMIPQAFHLYVIPALPIGTVFDRSFGLTGNPNEVSILMAICLPFFFRRGWAWCIPAVVLGLVLARTTNGMIAAGIVGMVYILAKVEDWYDRGSLIMVVITCAALFLCFVDKPNVDSQIGGRGLVYTRTAQLATVAPFGWGLRNFEFIMPLMTYSPHMSDVSRMVAFTQLVRKDLLDPALERVTGSKDPRAMREFLDREENTTTAAFTQAHNDYLEAAFTFGFAGLALLLMAAWRALVMGFRIKDRIPVLGLIASLACALFFFAWQLIPVAVLTTVILAVIVGENNKEASHA